MIFGMSGLAQTLLLVDCLNSSARLIRFTLIALSMTGLTGCAGSASNLTWVDVLGLIQTSAAVEATVETPIEAPELGVWTLTTAKGSSSHS